VPCARGYDALNHKLLPGVSFEPSGKNAQQSTYVPLAALVSIANAREMYDLYQEKFVLST
jgi:hypothetical protein